MPSSQLGILTHPYVLAGNCGRVGELHGYQFAEMKLVPVPLSAEGQGNVSRCWQGRRVLWEQRHTDKENYAAG